ncbi:unnamed protein product [Mytilus edulis]|uniref:Death domain-containing protein n=1 Tax=Mytilus edulis TaxID=6550 RepID=A0A8S3RYT3_MYTED|nr:unnamed protein product [Mytilus edulis]
MAAYNKVDIPDLTQLQLSMVFVSSSVYYGLNFNTKNLAGDRYLNIFISGLVEIPALVLVLLISNKIGRLRTISLLMMLAGVSCFSVLFIDLADISEENLDLIPTDEILDELAQVLGVVSFQLGIELGLLSTALDAIQYNNGRNLVAQCKEILFQWRIDEKVRPTIRVLVQALVNVGRGARCLEKIIKKVGVKAYIPQEEVEEQKQGTVATLLKKLNLFQKKN